MTELANKIKTKNYTDIAQDVLSKEISGLASLRDNLPADFNIIIDKLVALKGKFIVSGMGKSGHIAKKIAASFASTGTASFYIHPGEASHGDLGMITEDDMVMLLSNSGETAELADIINYCKRFAIPLIGMFMKRGSTLEKASDYILPITQNNEASIVDAPTTSAIMMLALGDALMVATHEAKGFTKEDFKIYHPGGKLGAKLLRVGDIMHKDVEMPLVAEEAKVAEVLLAITGKGFGCAGVMNNDRLVGIITDGDLRRHMSAELLQMSAKEVMTKAPKVASAEMLATEALNIMNNLSITSLFVVNEHRSVVGLIHIHDLLKAGIT